MMTAGPSLNYSASNSAIMLRAPMDRPLERPDSRGAYLEERARILERHNSALTEILDLPYYMSRPLNRLHP